jgi:putative glycosyltransferase
MRLSVVTTLYHSAPYLEEFFRRTVAALSPWADDLEFVFVDDGSPDASAAIARSFLARHEQVRVISLSRNYGHHRAIMVGLEHAEGDLVFLIDCDLEEPPELFEEMFRAYEATQASDDPADVVYVQPLERKGNWFERVSGEWFYKLFRWVSGSELPSNWMIARLMTRRYVHALVAHRERELFLGGLMWLTGFRQIGITGIKANKGSTTWTLRRKLIVACEALTTFTDRPLWALMGFGGLVSGTSFMGLLFLLLRHFAWHAARSDGWACLLLSISMFGGLIVSSIGLVGLYVARVLGEVKQRPCIVKEVRSNMSPLPSSSHEILHAILPGDRWRR